MPPPYGLTATGFNRKTSEDIQTDLETAQKGAISPLLDTSGLSAIGQNNAIFTSQLSGVWEALEQSAKQFDPLNAEGEALDSVCALTGTLRQPARRTVVQCNCLLIPGTTVTAGQMIATIAGDPSRRFRNSFAFTVPGSGLVGVIHPVQFECEVTGPVVCPATYLSVQASVVSGWLSIVNPLDGVTGAEVENDTDLRLRRERELSQAGSSTQPALVSALSAVDGVVSVTVLANDLDSADLNGVTPHAIEPIVRGGDDDAIALAIFQNKAAGDGTNGSTGVNVTSPDGFTYAIRFTRPTDRSIYLALHVQVTSDYPGDAALIAHIVEWAEGGAFQAGTDVVPSRVSAKCFEVPGVWNVVHVYDGFGAAPVTETVLAIAIRDIARFATGRVTVTVVP